MLKQPGETVSRNEVIAQSKSFFGLFKSSARATIDGTLENVSHVTGQVTLREAPIPVGVTAYYDGVVTEVMEREGVMIETTGAMIQGIFGIGGEQVGTLAVAVETPDQVATEEVLKDVAGKIVVVGAYASHDLIMKARAAGALGLVAGGMSDSDLKQLLGYDLGVAITGSEDIGLTVVVTEGFGILPIADKTFELLRTLQGRKVSINGATQIRAGVMRPEIIVPLLENRGQRETADIFKSGLGEGMTIRIIRQPDFGSLATVTGLPSELRPLESEARVRVLTAVLPDGTEITVPRANVEMIEG
jgi:hypothetical protein